MKDPGEWRLDHHAGVWRLRDPHHGNYTVKFSGYDFIVARHGSPIARRLTLQEARDAAEQDAAPGDASRGSASCKAVQPTEDDPYLTEEH